ncbi:hypothetical protein Agub_g13346, partial [Astrephomene gubernaculifera]
PLQQQNPHPWQAWVDEGEGVSEARSYMLQQQGWMHGSLGPGKPRKHGGDVGGANESGRPGCHHGPSLETAGRRSHAADPGAQDRLHDNGRTTSEQLPPAPGGLGGKAPHVGSVGSFGPGGDLEEAGVMAAAVEHVDSEGGMDQGDGEGDGDGDGFCEEGDGGCDADVNDDWWGNPDELRDHPVDACPEAAAAGVWAQQATDQSAGVGALEAFLRQVQRGGELQAQRAG